MDTRPGVSTAFIGTDDLRAKMKICRETGFSYLELSNIADDAQTYALLKDLAGAREETGLVIRSVHLPFGTINGKNYDMSSLDEATRQVALVAQQRIINAAMPLGPEIFVLHASFEPIPDADRSERLQACILSLKALCALCQELGVKVAVECLPRTCLGNTSAELLTIIQAVGDNLDICFDTNHLTAESNFTFIQKAARHIITTHVSDYDGINEKHWLPTKGCIPWANLLDALEAAGYQGPAVFEVGRTEKPVREALAELKAIWDGVLKSRVNA